MAATSGGARGKICGGVDAVAGGSHVDAEDVGGDDDAGLTPFRRAHPRFPIGFRS